jgi:hypothetical protein
MKNNLLWGAVAAAAVILIVVLLAGGRQAAVTGGNATSTSETQTTAAGSKTTTTTKTASSAPKPVEGMKVSLGGIFAEQGNYECDYEAVTPSQRTSSVVYVSNGKLRGEFRTSQTGKTNASIVVYDGTNLYAWTEGMATGQISQPKTLADLPGIIPDDVSSGRILGSGLNTVGWNCHAWSYDASLLQRPSYVTFN